MNVKNILEVTGIDLIPYAIGLSKFVSSPPFEPTKLSDIKEKIQNLDAKKIDEALKYSKELLDEESARGEKAESKAYNLIGVTGIATAFITGISSLFPKETQPSSLSVILILAFYILIVVSLTLTVLLASRAITVRSYTRPDISDIFQMGSQSLKEVSIDRLATYMYCYAKNCQAHNIKVSYLIGAQLWFRNSVVIFLILAFTLIPNFLDGATNNIQPPITVTPTLTTTLLQIQSAVTVTQTIIVPSTTIQPMITIKPTETPTLHLSATSSSTDISTPITNTS